MENMRVPITASLRYGMETHSDGSPATTAMESKMDRAADYIDSQQQTIDALVAALRDLIKDIEDCARDEGYTEPDAIDAARAALAAAEKE